MANAADTSTGADDKTQVVNAAIREISNIATLPEITLKIIELVEDPTSTAQDLHHIISNDPALCARILKVVNSSFYGLPGQIGNINRAIVLLGLNAVKNIAIAASLAKLFRGGNLTPNFAARDLWKHSVVTAAASKMVADAIGMGLADEAFLAGLIHDIGIVVELQARREGLIEVIEKLNLNSDGVPLVDMLEVEQQVLHATHQDFGMGLCESWQFPRPLRNVAGYHHRPLELEPGARTLACTVYIADRLAVEVGVGFRGDLPDVSFADEVLAEIGMTRDKLETILQELPEHLDSVMSMFS